MIPVPQETRRDIERNDFFKTCCHRERPEGHSCSGAIQMEHPFGRQGGGKGDGMAGVVVPVCSSCNYSPDKRTRAWSKLVAITIYGKEKLKELSPKHDWEAEEQFCRSFFA